MEKPIQFEGEDPLLLEPELRHRSGSMTPGSVVRTKKTPKTAPAGRKSRTKVKAPPATSVAQRLFVRPDGDNAPAAQTTPEDDSDDDEAGNDTFVDIKKRRQPPQRSALGSQPPLNASDLKSSDTVGEEDNTPKRPSPLIDLGRFVRHSSAEQEPAAGLEDDVDPAEAWNEPLFLPASPDSSVGSPPPQLRSPSPVQVVEKEEPESPARSPSPTRLPLFPPSSPPGQPSPIASQRSSPALHAPTPTLGVSSPIRPPPSSPAVIASPAFPPSPALRAPTPGGPNPSPLKARENLRKSVQVRSHAAGKRLSESLRSPSADVSEPSNEKASRQSRPSSSRLQSPFVDVPREEPAGSPQPPPGTHDEDVSVEDGEDDFNLEGDTVLLEDGDESLELEGTYLNTQEADAPSPPREGSQLPAPVHQDVNAVLRQSQVSKGSPTSDRNAGKNGGKARRSNVNGTADAVGSAAGSHQGSPESTTRPNRKRRDSGSVQVHVNAAEPSSVTRSQPPEPEPSQPLVREGTAEDPLLLEPPRSAAKLTASGSRQSWLDRVRARSSTPASPLAKKKSGGPVSSLDSFLAFPQVGEPSRLAPPQPSPQPAARRSVTPDVPRPRFSMSPSMARAWRPQGDSESSRRVSPPQVHPVEAVHGFEVGLEDTMALPSLNVSNAGDEDTPLDFSVDASFSDEGELGPENIETVQVERQELFIEVHGEDVQEASFDLSADTVREIDDEASNELLGVHGEEAHEASFDLSADTVGEIEDAASNELSGPALDENDGSLGDEDDHAESEHPEADKANSRSPYVSDDSPLADVVNAAIDAGMVIDAPAAAEDANVEPAETVDGRSDHLQTPPAPPPPQEEDSSDPESDDVPLMAPRLRRSLHAGVTPMRPKAHTAKVAAPARTQSPLPDEPVTPAQSQRPRVSNPTDRSPAVVHRPSSAASSSPFVRDYSSPFMVQPSASPVASVTRSSGGRSSRVQPEIVVEPSSPLASPPSTASNSARVPQPLAQDTTFSVSRRNVDRTPSRVGVTSGGQPSTPPSVPLASVERPIKPRPIRKSVTPTPVRPARASATPVQEPHSVERTVPTPIVAPTPRAIRPLPNRGASVTPRPVPQHDAPPSGSGLHSHISSRVSSRARSRSPLRNFSPKAIGTATAIAATALAAAVPAAASPSPATIRAQLSPEPELPPFIHSAVSPQHSVHPLLNAYRSPPRSSRSSRLSVTPSAHSTQSERSRSPGEPQDHSDHVSLANSRLGFALARLSDDDDDDLPSPPAISVTPPFIRSYARASSAASQPSPASNPLQRHDRTPTVTTGPGAERTPRAAGTPKVATPLPRREVESESPQQSAQKAKLAAPRPGADEEAESSTILARDQPKQATPRLRVESEAVTPRPREQTRTRTPQSSVHGRTLTPDSSVKATPQAKAQTPRSSNKAKVPTPHSSVAAKPTSRTDETATPTPGPRANTSTRRENRIPQQANTAFEDAEEGRDIGADDTVVHDIGADDTIEAGSAWDLTAAELTYDAEMTAFDAHAFKGADWDVTRIERVARGASEDHGLQDIDEADEEDTASQPRKDASPAESPEPPAAKSPVLSETSPPVESTEPPAAKSSAPPETRPPVESPELPAANSSARPKTPPPAPSLPKSPVRQSPRLAARRRAETPTQSPVSRPKPKSPAARADVRSPPQAPPHAPQAEGHISVRSPFPAREPDQQSVPQAEPAEREEPEEESVAGEEEPEQRPVPNHKVTLKVVTRIIKVESDSEDEEITEVVEAVEEKQQEVERPATSSEPSLERASDAVRQTKRTAPAPPTPPPAPPLPKAVPTANSETRVESTPSTRDHDKVPANTDPTPSQAKSKDVQTKTTPAPFVSKLPLATAGRPPATQPRAEASSSAQARPAAVTPARPGPAAPSPTTSTPSRPVQRPETPLGRTPSSSFVKEQSRQIEQALGRRPVVPSKLSKQVVPSSSPAESPVSEGTYSRPQSRASHEAPTSPSAARRRQSDIAETSFASSSSSSRLKRRYEDHFDDDDSERYAHRASLHEELTAASDSGSEFDPEFPSMVAVSSVDPRAAARAAAILKMHHNWVENGIMPDGSRVGTPGPERSRARSMGALETPQSTRRRTTHETPHSRFFDSIESSRLISKEELLHEAELELVGTSKSRPGTPFAADSPMRHIPGAWAATPKGRTPKRKRDSDEHNHSGHQTLETPFQHHSRYDSSTYEGNVDGRSWTKRDWKHLEKTFKYLASKAEGPGVDSEAVVDAFLKQTGKEPAGEWSREVLLMRVRALARRHGIAEATEDREAKRQKTTTPANAPPSTLKKVMGWLWRGSSKPQETAEPATASTSAAKSKKQKRDNDFLQTRDDSFEIGEVTMAATPSRPGERQHASPPPERDDDYYAERSFEVDLERGNQSYDIPYEEEEEDEEEFFPEPTTYTARGERSSVTEASTSMYDHSHHHSHHHHRASTPSSTRKIYPDLPNLHFPSRPHSLSSSTRGYEESRPAGSRLPVMGTPRPRARVRSDSSIADTSVASRPGSVRDMVRGFEETQELDLSFESARREREKNELLGLRRVRSVVEKVREQHQL